MPHLFDVYCLSRQAYESCPNGTYAGPPRDVVAGLEDTYDKHPCAAEALRFLAVHRFPAVALREAVLEGLVAQAMAPSQAIYGGYALSWALDSDQVLSLPALHGKVIAHLARMQCFDLLDRNQQQHRGVADVYACELQRTMQAGTSRSLKARALRLCATHEPPVRVPPDWLAELVRANTCRKAVARLLWRTGTPLHAELLDALLHDPSTHYTLYYSVARTPLFAERVHMLTPVHQRALPSICHLAMDPLTLQTDDLFRTQADYGDSPMFHGLEMRWAQACLRKGRRTRNSWPSSVATNRWMDSPLATLYYLDRVDNFPTGPHARHALLQVRREFRDECAVLNMDFAAHLLMLAMHDRRGANMACRGGLWRHLPILPELLPLIFVFI